VIAWRFPRARLVVLATALLVVGQALTWLLLRSQGNDLGGDQAHYLIAGQAISHLSFHPLAQYQRDFLTHFIYNWPTGAKVTDHTIVQTYPGPHGSVFAHGLGLPLLLGPFLAIGSVPVGLFGMFVLTALGFVCIHQRASLLAGVGRRGQVVFALVLAAPALWLAATQVYPDLLSGVLLAMALVELALIEQRKHVSRFGLWVIALALAFVPWLQVKNLAPALCCGVAAVVVLWRRGGQRRPILVLGGVVVLGWLLLAVYNQYYFSHLIGLPQPAPSFTLTTASRALALVFDTHQGLLVQVPTVMIGLVGLAMWRRVIPWTAAAAVVGALSMLVINGTFTSTVPFGGTDLAGRFQWTVLPMLLAWAPLCLSALERHRARVWAVGSVVSLLWIAQGVPVLLGDHVYVNSMIAPFAPWDPSVYPGWWPVIGGWLPTFLPPGIRRGVTWSHVAIEVIVLVAVTALLNRLTKDARLAPSRLLVVSGIAVVAALAVLINLPLQAPPASPLAFTAGQPGAPTMTWTGSEQPSTSPPASLTNIGPGRYTVSVSYAAAPGSSPATAFVMATPPQHVVASDWFTPHHPTDAALLKVALPPIAPATGPTARARLSPAGGHHRANLSISVTSPSVLTFYVTVGANSTFAASSLTVTKVSS
jgi:hypothetical protein